MLSTKPAGRVSVGLHNRTVLRCEGEGNPTPYYQWLQVWYCTACTGLNCSVLQGNRVRGYERELVIEDTQYGDQGEYTCMVANVIGQSIRTIYFEV